MERLSRRELLALIEIIAVSMALPACKRRSEPAARASGTGDVPAEQPPPPPSALDAPTFRALEAATARILPATAGVAGARDARVMSYIDWQLAILPFSRLAPAMLDLARGLDAQATTRGAKTFAQLDVAAQDAVLDELARGEWKGFHAQRELFQVLHGLTLEGFLSDPVHGGNHRGVGWAAIDFPEPPLRSPGGKHGGHSGHGG